MCGIAGFSLSAGSKVNVRALSNALLGSIESRGTDASGVAWSTEEGGQGVYKNPVRGSHLSLKALPKNANAVILHTRLGTHGTHLDNANNHPVQSPNGDLNLVHNGVIWNHQELRHLFALDGLPEVDSSVIPALIEKSGPDATEHLAGDAAIAWLDKETSNTLHLARVHGNPIAYATLLDGSFVFASTPQLLAAALIKMNLGWVGFWPEPFATFNDQDYIQVVNGKITNYYQLPESQGWGYYYGGSRGKWTQVTQGKKVGSEDSAEQRAKDDNDAYEAWWNDRSGGALYGTDGEYLSYEEDMERRQGSDDNVTNIAQKALTTGPARKDVFYVIDHDGDYQGYTSLDAFTNTLLWYAGRSDGENIAGAEGKTRWVNFFSDVGEIGDEGDLRSWVESPELTFFHEHELQPGDELDYVRAGADLLVKVLSA